MKSRTYVEASLLDSMFVRSLPGIVELYFVYVKVLLANAAEIDAASLDGETALLLAARRGHSQIAEVRLLVQYFTI